MGRHSVRGSVASANEVVPPRPRRGQSRRGTAATALTNHLTGGVTADVTAVLTDDLTVDLTDVLTDDLTDDWTDDWTDDVTDALTDVWSEDLDTWPPRVQSSERRREATVPV